jgi:hypothetical protein
MGRRDLPREELFSVADFLDQTQILARKEGFSVEIFAHVSGFDLPVLVRDTGNSAWLYVSSGTHGDEPAGPLAVKGVLERGGFSGDFNWLVFPVLNPTGLAAGTRETASGVDLNRDYLTLRSPEVRAHCRYLRSCGLNFLAALGLHEDWEASGGYLYEHDCRNQANPGRALLRVIAGSVGLESGPEIDGWPTSEKGLIHPPSDPDLRDSWPEQIFLLKHHTDMSYTVETPSTASLARRVDCHVQAVRAFGDRAQWG